MADVEFDIPVAIWGSMKQAIDAHHPYRITGRPTEAEGLKGLVITLHCDDQREGKYQVRYLVLGNGAPIQLQSK